MINKNKFQITDNKKLLHKVGKKWVIISALTLALLGAGGITSKVTHTVHPDVLTTTNIENQAEKLFGQLAVHADVNTSDNTQAYFNNTNQSIVSQNDANNSMNTLSIPKNNKAWDYVTNNLGQSKAQSLTNPLNDDPSKPIPEGDAANYVKYVDKQGQVVGYGMYDVGNETASDTDNDYLSGFNSDLTNHSSKFIKTYKAKADSHLVFPNLPAQYYVSRKQFNKIYNYFVNDAGLQFGSVQYNLPVYTLTAPTEKAINYINYVYNGKTVGTPVYDVGKAGSDDTDADWLDGFNNLISNNDYDFTKKNYKAYNAIRDSHKAFPDLPADYYVSRDTFKQVYNYILNVDDMHFGKIHYSIPVFYRESTIPTKPTKDTVTETIQYVYGSNSEGSMTLSGTADTSGSITATNASGISAGWHLASTSTPFTYSVSSNTVDVSVTPNTIADTVDYQVSDNPRFAKAGSVLNGFSSQINDDRAGVAGNTSLNVTSPSASNLPAGYSLASNYSFSHTTDSISSSVTDTAVIVPDMENLTVIFDSGDSFVSSATYSGYMDNSASISAPSNYSLSAGESSAFTYGAYTNSSSSVTLQVVSKDNNPKTSTQPDQTNQRTITIHYIDAEKSDGALYGKDMITPATIYDGKQYNGHFAAYSIPSDDVRFIYKNADNKYVGVLNSVLNNDPDNPQYPNKAIGYTPVGEKLPATSGINSDRGLNTNKQVSDVGQNSQPDLTTYITIIPTKFQDHNQNVYVYFKRNRAVIDYHYNLENIDSSANNNSTTFVSLVNNLLSNKKITLGKANGLSANDQSDTQSDVNEMLLPSSDSDGSDVKLVGEIGTTANNESYLAPKVFNGFKLDTSWPVPPNTVNFSDASDVGGAGSYYLYYEPASDTITFVSDNGQQVGQPITFTRPINAANPSDQNPTDTDMRNYVNNFLAGNTGVLSIPEGYQIDTSNLQRLKDQMSNDLQTVPYGYGTHNYVIPVQHTLSTITIQFLTTGVDKSGNHKLLSSDVISGYDAKSFNINDYSNDVPAGYVAEEINGTPVLNNTVLGNNPTQFTNSDQVVKVLVAPDARPNGFVPSNHSYNSSITIKFMDGTQQVGNSQVLNGQSGQTADLATLSVPSTYTIDSTHPVTTPTFTTYDQTIEIPVKKIQSTIIINYVGVEHSRNVISSKSVNGNDGSDFDVSQYESGSNLPNGYQFANEVTDNVNQFSKDPQTVNVYVKPISQPSAPVAPSTPAAQPSTPVVAPSNPAPQPQLQPTSIPQHRATASVTVSPANSTKTNKNYPIQYSDGTVNHPDKVTYKGKQYSVHYHTNGKNTIHVKTLVMSKQDKQVKKHNKNVYHYKNVVVSTNLPVPGVSSPSVIRAVDMINFNHPVKHVFTARELNKSLNTLKPSSVVSYYGKKYVQIKVPDHFRYFWVTKNVLSHLYMKNVGNAHKFKRILKAHHLLTIHIKGIFAIHSKRANYIRYEFNYKGHNYWVTARNDYTDNAYWQKQDFNVGHAIKQIRIVHNCILYKTSHYSHSAAIKSLHVGTILHVKKVAFIGKKGDYQTRFQLTNGNWVTANKNFVKIITK